MQSPNRNIHFRFWQGEKFRVSPANGHIELSMTGEFVSAKIYLPFGRVLNFYSPESIADSLTLLERTDSLCFSTISFDDEDEKYAVRAVLAEMDLRWRTDGPALLKYAGFSYCRSDGWAARLYNTGYGVLNHDTKNRLDTGVRAALRGVNSTEVPWLVGCPVVQLREHLQRRFQSGRTINGVPYPDMAWENMGHVWHIDHIRPCSEFNLLDISQRLQCYHYSNLQPLFAPENLSKSNKWGRDVEPLVHSHIDPPNRRKVAPPPFVSEKQKTLQSLLDEFLKTWFEENPAEVEWRGSVTQLVRGLYWERPETKPLKLEQISAHLERSGYKNEVGPRRVKIWKLPKKALDELRKLVQVPST